MVPTPRSARLVAWANAAVAGLVSPDVAAERVGAGDPPHRLDGLPGGDEQSLPVAVARLARRDVVALRLVLPEAGDPVGASPDGGFGRAALNAGEGCLLLLADATYGLAPSVHPTVVRWTAWPVATPGVATLPSLAETDRDLAVALREATELLAGLDVARWDDDAADALTALRDGALDGDLLAPGYPERAFAVLVRAGRLRAIVALARRSDGAAVTAGEAIARSDALRPLDRAARHAEMAAYNAVLEPGRVGGGGSVDR